MWRGVIVGMKLKTLNCNKQYGWIRRRRRRLQSSRIAPYQFIATVKATTLAVTEQQVQDALKSLTDPNTHQDYYTTKSARNIKIEGDKVQGSRQIARELERERRRAGTFKPDNH